MPDNPIQAETIVGSLVLQVGDAAGTTASQALPGQGASHAEPLARALQRTPHTAVPVPAAIAELERLLSSGDTITGVATHRVQQVQQQLDVLKEIAAGRRPEPESIATDLDLLLALIQRLDREARWRELIRVVRDVEAAFLLVRRWLDLVDSLQRVVVTAREIDDGLSRAWALHELGTLSLAADKIQEARALLTQAIELRTELHDRAGLEASTHNLVLADKLVPPRSLPLTGETTPQPRTSTLMRRSLVALLALATLVAGCVAGWAVGSSSDGAVTSASVTVTETTTTGQSTETRTVTPTETTTQTQTVISTQTTTETLPVSTETFTETTTVTVPTSPSAGTG